ncbi:MAG TPA: hypothetical protein EYO32_07905 [Rhodospirillales bacterium]|nr:hypothetical protein [Rhodospirillales bacterium]
MPELTATIIDPPSMVGPNSHFPRASQQFRRQLRPGSGADRHNLPETGQYRSKPANGTASQHQCGAAGETEALQVEITLI